ncbi:neurogenic locus notch homolog protein 2-like [Planococcus citri]|uniref:neurogenic locus notch homolog protein 2-like n=1 Tax=Planococcus citri TaxID=170843 RepID=UPI0031F7E4F2
MEATLRWRYFILIIFILNLAIIGLECKDNNKDPADICSKNPCYNGGKCSQTSVHPGYKCSCSGTGYYGNRCQNQCSKSGEKEKQKRMAATPPECIVI